MLVDRKIAKLIMIIMIPMTTKDSTKLNPFSCFLARLIGNFLLTAKTVFE